ncbi:unnamed protein product [Protopolystoma xenopodis]|uniref:Uncharacterized protein n=1 Tax=Protopolystoma xenopodis TaxID=117903 RepID=A0A3S5CJM8_9PLAT|nr:unnamed protein product [Protopolystoma xenopodis]
MPNQPLPTIPISSPDEYSGPPEDQAPGNSRTVQAANLEEEEAQINGVEHVSGPDDDFEFRRDAAAPPEICGLHATEQSAATATIMLCVEKMGLTPAYDPEEQEQLLAPTDPGVFEKPVSPSVSPVDPSTVTNRTGESSEVGEVDNNLPANIGTDESPVVNFSVANSAGNNDHHSETAEKKMIPFDESGSRDPTDQEGAPSSDVIGSVDDNLTTGLNPATDSSSTDSLSPITGTLDSLTELSK